MLKPRASESITLVAGSNISILDNVDGSIEISASGAGGAPTDATYVVASSNGTLSAERVLTAGTGVSLDISTPGQIAVSASGGLTQPQTMARGLGA